MQITGGSREKQQDGRALGDGLDTWKNPGKQRECWEVWQTHGSCGSVMLYTEIYTLRCLE